MKIRVSFVLLALFVLSVLSPAVPCRAEGDIFAKRIAGLQTLLTDLDSTLRDRHVANGSQDLLKNFRQQVHSLSGELPAEHAKLLATLDLETERLSFALSQQESVAGSRHIKNAGTLLQVLAVRTSALGEHSRHGHQGGMVSKPCAFCGAKGKDLWGTLCKICGGDGYVLAPKDSPICAGCQGKGKDMWGTICAGCAGTGWANASVEPGNGGGHGHHGSDWSLQLCGTCTGKGKDLWGTLCKPCGGDGYVAIQGEPLTCSGCQGKGKDMWGTTCPGCAGTGWANTGANPTWGGQNTSIPCGFCGGKGKDMWGTICTKCGGDGYSSGPSDQKQCASCGGKGKDLWGTACAGCQGNGFARFMEKPVLTK